jgi:hypothetical protein
MADVERTVQEENELRRQETLARMRRMRDAALALFGPPGKPTPLGGFFLEELDKFCGRSTIADMPTDKNGQTDVPRTFRAIGRREVADLIHNAIEWKEPNHERNSP